MNESLSRITRYAQMLHDKPLSQMGDVVHGIHTGTEWEAELRISDLREVLNLIEELKAALANIRDFEPERQAWSVGVARAALKEVSDEGV